ncbi:hypothetical protein ACWCRD_32315 [Streptomyces sp. NPDC002092]
MIGADSALHETVDRIVNDTGLARLPWIADAAFEPASYPSRLSGHPHADRPHCMSASLLPGVREIMHLSRSGICRLRRASRNGVGETP